MSTGNFAGQSFTVPAGNGIDNIRFSWYVYNSLADQLARNEAPTAFGTLYILNQEFLGKPSDLSSATPGFIARSDSSDGQQYVFAPATALSGGTKYWVYTDAAGAFVVSFNSNTYNDGDNYIAAPATQFTSLSPFRKNPASSIFVPGGGFQAPPPGTFQDADFRLQASAK